MASPNLQDYPATLLDQLADLVPAWRDAIAAERQRRAEQQRIWNSAITLTVHLRAWQERRWQQGYTPNEEARGVDEREADDWQQMRRRIYCLRSRALRRLNHRHRGRTRGPQ